MKKLEVLGYFGGVVKIVVVLGMLKIIVSMWGEEVLWKWVLLIQVVIVGVFKYELYILMVVIFGFDYNLFFN